MMMLSFLASVRRAHSSKLRGPGFKSWPGTVGGPATISVGCSARLKTSFELNPVTEGKQGTFLSYLFKL